jgi:hypothetical protein
VKKAETKKQTPTKRQVAAILLVLALGVDVVGWFVAPVFISDVTISHIEHDTVDYWLMSEIHYPVVNVTLSISFTAQASLCKQSSSR